MSKAVKARWAAVWPGLGLVPLVLGVLLILSPAAIPERLRTLIFDQYQVWSPRSFEPDGPVRIIAIDDQTLAEQGRWPWPHAQLAELIKRVLKLQPAAIGVDILLAEPDRDQAGTAELASVLRVGPLVLAAALTPANTSAPEPKAGISVVGADPAGALPRFRGAAMPLPELREAAAGVGAVNVIPDRDTIVRKVPIAFAVGPAENSTLIPSFDLELLRVAQQAGSPILRATGSRQEWALGGGPAVTSARVGGIVIPTDRDAQVRIKFAGHNPQRFISAGELLAGNVARSDIEGRIILLGTTATAVGDIHATPTNGAIPGIEVHAELLEHALTGSKLQRPDYAQGLEAIVTLLAGLAIKFLGVRQKPVASAMAILALTSGAAYLSWLLYAESHLLFDPALPAATWLATWSTVTVIAFRKTEAERAAVRAAFSRYLAPSMVERLARNPSALRLGGESREVSVLFADIRNFTTRSETMEAHAVVTFLNRVLTPLSDVILENEGTIDKFLGDGVMAFWNAPVDQHDHAQLACSAALAMLDAVARLTDDQPIAIGIGITTGPAFVGNLGSEQRFNYSMVGDTVNVAARLESASKDLGVSIVTCATTAQHAAGFRFVPLGRVSLKGKTASTQAFALHGENADGDDGFDAFVKAHERLLAQAATGADLAPLLRWLENDPHGRRYARFYKSL